MLMTKIVPNSRRNLDVAIERISAQRGDPLRIRAAMANTILGQMLPDGAIKGGSALKLRYGDAATRFTRDLDTARASDIDAYIEKLERCLEHGWHGFTGHVIVRKPAKPKNVPSEYVMQPFSIKLEYNHKPWITVELEVGSNEIGDAEEPEFGISPDIVELFTELGFPAPEPVALMPLCHQIAQKLHGLTGEDSDRAHDLVDLQIMLVNSEVDFTSTRATCIRLFAHRRLQAWPPVVRIGEEWVSLYAKQADGMDVLSTVEQAVSWANNLIDLIDSVEQIQD